MVQQFKAGFHYDISITVRTPTTQALTQAQNSEDDHNTSTR